MAAMHKERNCGVRSGWHGAARSGFARSDTERLARHGLDWPREMRTAGRERRGPSSRCKDPQAWSDVDYQRETWICRHGAAWSTRRDTERLAWRRKDGHRLFRLGRHGMASLREEGCGWRGSALLRSDGTVLELLAWLGGRATLRLAWIVMIRWA